MSAIRVVGIDPGYATAGVFRYDGTTPTASAFYSAALEQALPADSLSRVFGVARQVARYALEVRPRLVVLEKWQPSGPKWKGSRSADYWRGVFDTALVCELVQEGGPCPALAWATLSQVKRFLSPVDKGSDKGRKSEVEWAMAVEALDHAAPIAWRQIVGAPAGFVIKDGLLNPTQRSENRQHVLDAAALAAMGFGILRKGTDESVDELEYHTHQRTLITEVARTQWPKLTQAEQR